MIWTPEFADLSVSIDYFDIEVEDEVTKLGANNIMRGCYDLLNFATEPLCDLFTRNGPGGATQFLVVDVTDNFLNIATQKNRGIDFDAVYATTIPWGDLTLRAQASYQLEDEIQLLPTSEPDDLNGRIGDPEWVGNLDATLKTGPFEFFYGVRYVGETSNVEHFGNQAADLPVRDRPLHSRHEPDLVSHRVCERGADRGPQRPPRRLQPVRRRAALRHGAQRRIRLPSATCRWKPNYDFFGRTVFLNITKSF